MRSPYSDVAVVSASGDKIIYNITNDGYIAGGPQWALDGNAVIFIPIATVCVLMLHGEAK